MQEPGNVPPYGQTPPGQPPYQPPIPSPVENNGPGGAIPPFGRPEINFDAIGRAWQILQPNMGVWVVAYLIYMVVIYGVSFGTQALVGGGITMPVPNASGQINTAPQVNFLGLGISYIVQMVVIIFMMSGLYRMGINHVRTGRASIGDMFSVVDVLPSVFVASLIGGLAYFGGVLCCVIPGLLIMSLLMFMLPLIVDAKLGPIQAISLSCETLKGQMWMALAFLLVTGLLASAGVLACCVGMLVTGPLQILSISIAYRDFFPTPPSPTTA